MSDCRRTGSAIALALYLLAPNLAAPVPAAESALPLPACLAGAPVAISVRIGGEIRQAWLRGGVSPALQVVDALTQQPLWSASAWPPASQQFEALQAQFAGSLLALDLDGDGLHDRLYAGDLAGRLWRFDLHHGQPAEHWATGGIFANLSAGAARGFLAPPDVSMPASRGDDPPVFNIALGTARLGAAATDNRFYVLRDRHPFESWPQATYDRWSALRETDLQQVSRLGAELPDAAPDGYFAITGADDMLSPTITVSGRTTLALAEAGAALAGRCVVSVQVSAIDLATGADWSSPAPAGTAQAASLPTSRLSLAAGEPFALLREGSHATCLLGGLHIASCDVNLAPRTQWWRREDAD